MLLLLLFFYYNICSPLLELHIEEKKGLFNFRCRILTRFDGGIRKSQGFISTKQIQ